MLTPEQEAALERTRERAVSGVFAGIGWPGREAIYAERDDELARRRGEHAAILAFKVLLNVEDVARSLAFYCGKLGFTLEYVLPSPEAPVFAEVSRGAARILLNTNDHVDSGQRRVRPSYGETVLYCQVPHAHEVHLALSARGAPVGPVVAEDYGMDEFLVRDPDGYEIAFGSEIKRED